MRISAYNDIVISHNYPFAKQSRHKTPTSSLSYMMLHAEYSHFTDVLSVDA